MDNQKRIRQLNELLRLGKIMIEANKNNRTRLAQQYKAQEYKINKNIENLLVTNEKYRNELNKLKGLVK